MGRGSSGLFSVPGFGNQGRKEGASMQCGLNLSADAAVESGSKACSTGLRFFSVKCWARKVVKAIYYLSLVLVNSL